MAKPHFRLAALVAEEYRKLAGHYPASWIKNKPALVARQTIAIQRASAEIGLEDLDGFIKWFFATQTTPTFLPYDLGLILRRRFIIDYRKWQASGKNMPVPALRRLNVEELEELREWIR